MRNIALYLGASFLFLFLSQGKCSGWEPSGWKGNISHFSWNQSDLQLNSNGSSTSSIYKQIQWSTSLKISFSSTLNFSPSSSNQLSIDFASPDSLFSGNYHSIKIGESGANDGPDLFYNQQKVKLSTQRNMGKGGVAHFELEQIGDSLHIVIRDAISKNEFSILNDNPTSYLRIKCKYTSSNAKKIKFENYHEALTVADLSPPKLKNIHINTKSIQLLFDEKTVLFAPTSIPQADSIAIHENLITLHFNEELKDNWITFSDSVSDVLQNSSLLDTTFFYNRIDPYDIIITEILADPFPVVDLYDKEFIEIYNNSAASLSLEQVTIKIDQSTYQLNDTVLKVNEHYVVYPNSLNNTGCQISILVQEKIIHSVYYTPLLHANEFKKNGGWSLELIDYNKPCVSNNNWSSSVNALGATPNQKNSVVNHLQTEDSLQIIEIFPINNHLLKVDFNFPVLDEEQVFSSLSSPSLTFDSLQISADSILLFCEPMDSLQSYSIELISPINTCFPIETYTGKEISFGIPSLANVNDLIINEILFNPSEGGSDYIEIKNISNTFINLKNYYLSSKNQQGELTDFHLISNKNQLISPGEIIAISKNPQWVKKQFKQFGRIISGQLPACNINEDYLAIINKSAEIINDFKYDEKMHYQALSTFKNLALERINEYPNSPWFSASGLYNYGTPGLPNSQSLSQNKTKTTFEIQAEVITPNLDGNDDLLIITNQFSEPGWVGTIKIYDSAGITIHTLLNNELLSTNNTISWDCSSIDNSAIKAGVYAILIEYWHEQQGVREQEKITFYINR